jgi:uncharacterized protein YndB with AHSA1/START domain
MNRSESSGARAMTDLAEGFILATVEIEASPERVFNALTSKEIVEWWVRPGVFDTREWEGDVRVGGHWRASGLFRGQPYVLEGEFLAIEPPGKLVHTYGVGTPWGPTTVSYVLEGLDRGTRLTLRHSGFTSREKCLGNQLGWESSLRELAASLAPEPSPTRR